MIDDFRFILQSEIRNPKSAIKLFVFLAAQQLADVLGGIGFAKLFSQLLIEHQPAYLGKGLNVRPGLVQRRDEQDDDAYRLTVNAVKIDWLFCDSNRHQS
jgi:hypothetical protein